MSNGLLCISAARSFSLLAKVARHKDLWANARQKQSAREMALSHLYAEASRMRGEVSSVVM